MPPMSDDDEGQDQDIRHAHADRCTCAGAACAPAKPASAAPDQTQALDLMYPSCPTMARSALAGLPVMPRDRRANRAEYADPAPSHHHRRQSARSGAPSCVHLVGLVDTIGRASCPTCLRSVF